MAKQSKIRWKDNELDELRKLTRNYNAKLKRERDKLINNDKRYEAAHLPENASMVTLKHMTRKDMEKERSRMTHYVKTGERYEVNSKVERMAHSTARDFNAKITKLEKNIERETKAAINERRDLKKQMKGMQKNSDAYKKASEKVEQLDKVVNAKQGRLAALPQKISSKQLKREASDVKELEANLKLYKGFLKRGAEDLVDVPGNNNNTKQTKWQRDLFAQLKPGIDARRAKELQDWKDTEVKYGGVSTGKTHAEMGMTNDDYRLQPFNPYNASATNADLRKKLNMAMREKNKDYFDARTRLARDNYLRTMERILGNDEAGKLLMQTIKKMSLDDFKRVLTEEDDLWGLLYDLKTAVDDASRKIILSRIWSEWRKDDYFEWLDSYLDKKTKSIQ